MKNVLRILRAPGAVIKSVLCILALLPAFAIAAGYSTPDDFAGQGISAGEARRLSDRANENRTRNYTGDDFSGMGVSRGAANRAADTLNQPSYSYPQYRPQQYNPYGSADQ